MRARGRLASGLLGSVAYAVTAHAKCPAVVVRGHETVYPDAIHEVVVGVDDSEVSERALEVAAAAVRAAARDDYRFSSIVMGIVKSAPFQMRRVGDAPLQPSTMNVSAGQ